MDRLRRRDRTTPWGSMMRRVLGGRPTSGHAPEQNGAEEAEAQKHDIHDCHPSHLRMSIDTTAVRHGSSLQLPVTLFWPTISRWVISMRNRNGSLNISLSLRITDSRPMPNAAAVG